jgi:hypothetical protein
VIVGDYFTRLAAMHKLLAEYHRKLAKEAVLDIVRQYHIGLGRRLADEHRFGGLGARRFRGPTLWQERSPGFVLMVVDAPSTDCARTWIGPTISATKRPCIGN